MAYTVTIEGVFEAALRETLEASSQLIALRNDPPHSINGLLGRAERDRDRFLDALRSEGFYDATVTASLDRDAAPLGVRLTVDTGNVYLLEDYAVSYSPRPPESAGLPDGPEALGLSIGMPARAPEIEQARREIVTRLGQIGHPLARIRDHKVVIDHSRETMRVSVEIDPGPAVTFGPLAVTGLSTVDEDYVRRLVPWREGETYDARQVSTFRTRLARTGLFDGVTVAHAAVPDAAGRLPIDANLTESPHRTIGAGARYSTDIGASVNASWEHRNFLGENETVSLSALVGELEQSLTSDVTKPNFHRFDQSLLFNATARRQQDDAFDEKILALFAGLERAFDRWRVRGGPSLDYSVLNDNDGTQNISLIGLPVSASRDDTDDLLDPGRGTRLRLATTPYVSVDESITFLSLEATGSAYLAVDPEKRFVFAVRGRAGSLLGEKRATIPANKRFYAGGGGSVRGYPFRSLGPLDAKNDPLGGRSVVEAGGELRIRVTEDIGLVPFVEGGGAFAKSNPDDDSNLRWAAGLGLRYYTAIGPLRLDVAVPLDRRPGVDNRFEFYVSIGQAF